MARQLSIRRLVICGDIPIVCLGQKADLNVSVHSLNRKKRNDDTRCCGDHADHRNNRNSIELLLFYGHQGSV